MNKTVYVLGNPLLESDNLPLRLLPLLRKECRDIQFEILDPTEEFSSKIKQDIILIDTVIGINKVTVFYDLKHFASSPRITAHDFDLPINLGILQKLKKIRNITIIGIPANGKKKEILKETIDALYNQLTFRK